MKQEWKPRDTILFTLSTTPEETQAIIKELGLVEDRFRTKDISVAFARQRNERRRQEMEKAGLASLLEGRGSTGRQVFGKKGVPNGEIGKLLKDAKKLGYRFVKACWHKEPMWDRQSAQIAADRDYDGNEVIVIKTTIDIVFEKKPDSKAWPDDVLKDIIKYFRRRPFRFVHVFVNPTGVDAIELACGSDLEVGTYRRIRLSDKLEYYIEEVKNERAKKLARSA